MAGRNAVNPPENMPECAAESVGRRAGRQERRVERTKSKTESEAAEDHQPEVTTTFRCKRPSPAVGLQHWLAISRL